MIVAARLPRWIWPHSLAGRTALVLLVSLVLVQVLGLTIHALDRVDLIEHAQVRVAAVRAASLYRSVLQADRAQQLALVKEFSVRDDSDATIDLAPPSPDLPLANEDEVRRYRKHMALLPLAPELRPGQDVWFGSPDIGHVTAGLQLADGRWLNISMLTPAPSPWFSNHFLIAFAIMSVTAVLLTLWAVRRMVEPVVTLAAAAERLGRDVNAPPLPEGGPAEVSTAAIAFNTMAERIRRLLSDRNLMLAAISHDLRTPITRLKLRAEFMEDSEQHRKMLADLDELEAMVAASLAVGRDTAADEPLSPVDLVALVRTVLDETADAQPDTAEQLAYSGATSLTVQARPFALKRALTNLVINAVKYGGSALVTVHGIAGRQVRLTIEDSGPGIPPEECDRLFQPFQRLETSRNRETGGVGLGLTIARNIMRAHGGEVTLTNRATGGTQALVTLPV